MKVYNVPDKEINSEFIKKYNKPELLRGFKARQKIIQFGGIAQYKQYLVNKSKSYNNEYTDLNKKYNSAQFLDKLIALDVMEIMSDNKSFDLIKEPQGRIIIPKPLLLQRINEVIDKFRNSADLPYKLKNKLLSATANNRLRVINAIIMSVVDIKILKIKGNKNNVNLNYRMIVGGFVK